MAPGSVGLSDDGKEETRNYFQVYAKPGRQPLHFDGGLTWYLSPQTRGRPPTLAQCLSSILHCNDGEATYMPSSSPPNIFIPLRKRGLEAKAQAMASTNNPDALAPLETCNKLATKTQKLISKFEDFAPNPPRRNRAGQLFLFHPGEQLHAGVGYEGEVDLLNPDFVGRVILSPLGSPSSLQMKWINSHFFQPSVRLG